MSTLLDNPAEAKTKTARSAVCPDCGNAVVVRVAPDRTPCFVVHKTTAGTTCPGSLADARAESGVRS